MARGAPGVAGLLHQQQQRQAQAEAQGAHEAKGEAPAAVGQGLAQREAQAWTRWGGVGWGGVGWGET